MNQIRVWAPKASCVKVCLADAAIPMQREHSGWWSASLPQAELDYAFSIDDGPPLPDPRSPSQPFGVHSYSRTVDHSAFPWTDSDWYPPSLQSAIIYELHIGTFTPQGTFDAAISRIPYLVHLGVTHVELMPVAAFPGDRGWGYDGVSLYAPHHGYGGPDGLKRLVDALHANGLAVILDVVYNHLGPSGNYLSQFGPYFTGTATTPWGEAVNLSEAGSDQVRAFFIDNAVTWLRDYHFDALRLDAVHAITDRSAIHFLEELAARVKELQAELGRTLHVIAESDLNDPRLLHSPEAGGYALAAQWSDDFHHAVHALLTGERTGYYGDFGSLAHLAKAIECGFVYDGQYSSYRDRRHGRPLDPSFRNRLIGCIQNHDQIGNRAAGDRLHTLTSTDRVKVAAALLLLGPFIPLLFMGEEWGASSPFQYFTSHSEPELAAAVSQGRRREFAAFGWSPEDVPDPQDPATFERSKLNWREIEEAGHAELLDWYRHLIEFRKAHPKLTSSEARVTFDETKGTLIMHRPDVAVICNFHADGSASVEIVEERKDAAAA